MKTWQVVLFVGGITLVMLSVAGWLFGYYWLTAQEPIWRVRSLSYWEKRAIAADIYSDLSDVKTHRVYLLHPDTQTEFVVVVLGPFLQNEDYPHRVYCRGHPVSGDRFPTSKDCDRQRLKITTLAKEPMLHCWLVEGVPGNERLVWQISEGSTFRNYSCVNIAEAKPSEYAELQGVLDRLYTSGRGKWFLLFSERMLAADATRYRSLVTRYAAGKFTARERAQNKADGISNARVQQYAQQMRVEQGW